MDAFGGSSTLRILIVNHYAHVTGGVDEYCLSLAACLRERGHDVAWLSTASPANREGAGVFLTASVTHGSRYRLSPGERAGVAARALWNPAAAAAMRRLLADFRPDVVNSHKLYPQLSVAPVVMAARAAVPVVQTLHDYELISASPFDHTGDPLDRQDDRLEFRILNTGTFLVRRLVHRRCVSSYVSVSRFVADVYQHRGVSSTVVENAVPAVGCGTSPEYADREGILFAGFLSEHKGVGDVIELAKGLPEASVTIAGFGPLEDRVRRESERLRNLDYAGWVNRDRLRSLYRSSRLVVVPSHWEEPSGLIQLEAFACGTPVVAYPKGGLEETITSTGAGRIAQLSVGGLTEACSELYHNEVEWRERSSRALKAVRYRYSLASWADALCDVYASAAGRSYRTA